jgi:nucleoside-diphosphate-sugar epimerase
MILITGATGFLGKNLVPVLAKYSKLRILARRTSNIQFFNGKPNIEIVFGDIEKNVGIVDGLKNIDMVIHAAARTMGKNYLEYHQTNVLGTLNIVRSMEQEKVKKILLLSSHAACGPSPDKRPLSELARPQPISSYGRTKLAAENIVTGSALNYVILRPVSVFGPYDMDVLRYVRFITQGISPVSGCGEKHLNLIYVEDLVQAIVKIVRNSTFNNRTYFVNDGVEYELHDILDKIANLLHKNTHQVCIPKSIAMIYGLINDIFLPARKRVVWRDKIRELAQKYWLCSNERITNEYAFRANFTLDQALQKTMEWYKNKGFLG